MLRTAIFFVLSVVTAWVAQVVYEIDSTALMIFVSAAALLPACGVAWWLAWKTRAVSVEPSRLSLLWMGVSAPFPYTLVMWLYGLRTGWTSEVWAEYINNPTAYLLFSIGLLAISMAWTSVALRRALPRGSEPAGVFRGVTLTMFVLMGAVASLGDPVWATELFQYVLEPLGTVLFGTVFGWQLGAVRERGGLGLANVQESEHGGHN